MTQTYAYARAIDYMRDGRCPECGNDPEDHSAGAFWLPRSINCDLTPVGVTDRIAKQRSLDEEDNNAEDQGDD
jgi:hypothetical protein